MRRLGPKVRSGEARFGLELDWGKLWRGQVFMGKSCGGTRCWGPGWARQVEENGRKLLFFLGIQTPRLAPKSEDSRLVWGQN